MQPAFAHPLPDSWSPPELFQDAIVAGGLELHRVGVSVRSPTGEEITGAAVEMGSAPVARGYFELLERVSTLEAIAGSAPLHARTTGGDPTRSIAADALFGRSDDPERWRFARSNGVAIYDSWERACERAHLELVERDRILRCWYGETRARELEIPSGTSFDGLAGYELVAYSFPPAAGVTFGDGVEVVGVFGFPLQADLPLLLGYAANPSRRLAIEGAIRESLQALGFLWGEALPRERPPLGPTPAAHVEAILYRPRHELIRAWLRDGHQHYAAPECAVSSDGATAFFDLTPPWLDGLFVAKADCPQAAPLAFGDSPFVQHLPADLRAHPIP